MTTPQLTVGVVYFNGENDIRACLDSILAQTFTDFQVIISDNCSTDGSVDIIKEYAARDSRLVFWPTAANLGLASNFMRMQLAANTEYYVNVHHDQRWAPTYLEECIGVLKGDEQVILAYSQCQFIDQNGAYLDLYRDAVNFADPDPVQRYLNIIAGIGWCTAWNGVRRHVDFLKSWLAGLHINESNAAVDNHHLARLVLAGKVVQIEKPLFFRVKDDFQQTGEGMTASYARRFKCIGQKLPYFALIRDHCTTLLETNWLSLEQKNELILQTITLLTLRYKSMLDYELNRAIDQVSIGDCKTNHGDEISKDTKAPSSQFLSPILLNRPDFSIEEAPLGKYVYLDFIFLEGLRLELDYARNIWPDFPGLNYARALIYNWLGRRMEAIAMLEEELKVSPIDRKSLELKAKLIALQK